MKAVGIHVFAGGFSVGVQNYFNVDTHLEKHGFGIETAAKMCNVEVINGEWPHVEADFAFGNPRCTGFSTITAGYDEHVRGPNAACTIDIHQFMDYCLGRYPIFVWESVQQAMSTGRPLVDYCAKRAVEAGYRVAHVLVNAASLGNAQQRKRYFFVAYEKSKNFNVVPPELPEYSPTLYDAIWHMRDQTDMQLTRLTEEELSVLEYLPNGWDLNAFAQYNFDLLPDRYKDAWLLRNSDMPFSMHCVKRLNWARPSPTIFSSAGRFIHPDHNRGLSHEEIAAIMGLPMVPLSRDPVAETAKGVCPCVGEWLALQARYYLENAWGDQDYESSWDPKQNIFVGGDCNGAAEKTFDLTHYVQTKERDFTDVGIRYRRHNVDPSTGKLIRSWSAVAESRRRSGGDIRMGGPTAGAGSHVLDE